MKQRIIILSMLLLLNSVFIHTTTTNANLVLIEETKNEIITNEIETVNKFLLGYSSYLGGNSQEKLADIHVDSNGDMIVTGDTFSTDFPSSASFNGQIKGYNDAYVAKYSPNGTLHWGTFYGEFSNEFVKSSVVDSQGNIIIVGETLSYNLTMMNSYNSTYGGGGDVFLVKFDTNGQLLWSTFYGGSSYDDADSVAVDSNDNIIIGGQTGSNDLPSKNAQLGTYNAQADGFVAKYASNGTLLWDTYIPGNNNDFIYEVTVDQNDYVIAAGDTFSSDIYLRDAYDSTLNGTRDVMFYKISPMGRIIFGSYLGGVNYEFLGDITTDSSNNIVLVGETGSDDFPVRLGEQNSITGSNDGFVVIFDQDFEVSRGTFYGGSGSDNFEEVVIDDDQNIIVAGNTLSYDFPVLYPYSSSYHGIYDAVVVQFSPYLKVEWSTMFGGNNQDFPKSITVDSNGDYIIYTETKSTDLPLSYGFDNQYDGISEGYISLFFNPNGDTDKDGLNNLEEGKLGLEITNPDTDGDGMDDNWEYQYGLQPNDPADRNKDLDGDNLPNYWEFEMGLYPHINDASEDKDADKLNNQQEFLMGLDAMNPDTDFDFLLDGEEVYVYHTLPDVNDTDGDLLSDGEEVFVYHTNPLEIDTDGDDIADGQEILNGDDPLVNQFGEGSDLNNNQDSDQGFLHSLSLFLVLISIGLISPIITKRRNRNSI